MMCRVRALLLVRIEAVQDCRSVCLKSSLSSQLFKSEPFIPPLESIAREEHWAVILHGGSQSLQVTILIGKFPVFGCKNVINL
jgi:hypothetical protein